MFSGKTNALLLPHLHPNESAPHQNNQHIFNRREATANRARQIVPRTKAIPRLRARTPKPITNQGRSRLPKLQKQRAPPCPFAVAKQSENNGTGGVEKGKSGAQAEGGKGREEETFPRADLHL